MAVAVTETPAIDKPIQIIKMKGRTSKSLFSKGFSELQNADNERYNKMRAFQNTQKENLESQIIKNIK